jgi:hypothetical protein
MRFCTPIENDRAEMSAAVQNALVFGVVLDKMTRSPERGIE